MCMHTRASGNLIAEQKMEYFTVTITLMICTLMLSRAACVRNCIEDSDCAALGDLYCIKSMCTWGICGCHRGYAARFVGSGAKFQCVKLKRIGEDCSTSGTTGVCGAQSSQCVSGTCQCDVGTESRWAGETCLPTKTGLAGSESCSAAIGSCEIGLDCMARKASMGYYSASSLLGLANSPFDELPNTCQCPVGSRATIVNQYGASAFMGKSIPMCQPVRLGEMCLMPTDCASIKVLDEVNGVWSNSVAAECSSNRCICPSQTTFVRDITGLYCAPGMGPGKACAWNNNIPAPVTGVCDGTKGLRCGDPCDVETFEGSGNHTCVCDPGWENDSGTCSKKTIGATCHGDFNCKSIDLMAICVDGLCQNTARAITWSITTWLLATLVHFVYIRGG